MMMLSAVTSHKPKLSNILQRDNFFKIVQSLYVITSTHESFSLTNSIQSVQRFRLLVLESYLPSIILEMRIFLVIVTNYQNYKNQFIL